MRACDGESDACVEGKVIPDGILDVSSDAEGGVKVMPVNALRLESQLCSRGYSVEKSERIGS